MPRPERIVSLISSATEILFALGLDRRIVAVSHECDFPPAARDKPRATRSLVDSSAPSFTIDDQVKRAAGSGAALYGLDADLLRRLQPDLIITQAQCDVCAVSFIEVARLVQTDAVLRHASLLTLNPQSLADVLVDIVRVGEATGKPSAAARLAVALQVRVDAVRSKTSALSESDRPRVVCLEWTDPPMAAGNWTPELIALAGGSSGLATAGQHSRYCTWDEVAAYDPDVLLVAPCGFDLMRSLQEAQPLTKLAGWNDLVAVRKRRVYAVDGNAYLNRSGPRLVESLEILAHLLHPTEFDAPSLAFAWRQL